MKNQIILYSLLFIFCPSLLLAQEWKSYEISKKGDTINKIDQDNLRQGKWYEVQASAYGNEGFYAVGYYADNKKYGTWRSYTTTGIIMVEENYKNGYRHGKIKYYDNGYLVCSGQYLALNTKQPFDTIMVDNPDTDIAEPRVISTALGSVKHGFWVFYKIPSFEIDKVREYQLDEMIYEKDYVSKADSAFIKKRQAVFPHKTKGSPSNIWIKNTDKNRKAPRFTDFKENETNIIPNVRRKKKQ